MVTTSIFVVVVDVATSNDTASNVVSPAVDAKSVAEVNDIIEDIFLITLNKGWFYFFSRREFVLFKHWFGPALLADHTAAHSMIGYCHDAVVHPSVCDAVHCGIQGQCTVLKVVPLCS